MPIPTDSVAHPAPPPSDLEGAIDALRHTRKAVILAHYYQDEDIQDIADFVGDSLDLSKKAAATDADVIVFCGVRFMAEVAKILSPNKTVLLPDMKAGCSLEDSCPPDRFRAFCRKHPSHIVVTYINCSAEVKALSDIIVTSANAEKIIRSIPHERPILFAPDRHLGAYLMRKTGRDMLLWPGTCIVHEQFSQRELIALKHRHREALVVAHPECQKSILDCADHIGSTSSMLHFVRDCPSSSFIVATEPNIMHQMRKIAPGKNFIPAPGADGNCDCARCPYMAMNTMEKLYYCLRDLDPRIDMDDRLRLAAQKPLKKMLALSAPTDRKIGEHPISMDAPQKDTVHNQTSKATAASLL